MILTVANRPELVRDGNRLRRAMLFQNNGPGVIILNRNHEPGSMVDGVRIEVGGIIEDNPPGPVHRGAWYGMTDTANTTLTVEES